MRYISFRRLRLKLQLLEQQAALDKERARIAKDLHDDLGTRLTKIVLLSGLAQRDRALPEKAVEHLRKLSTAARHVINALDETVWAVNPRNDTLAHLINYIGQFAVEFLKTAEIRCRIDLPERPPRCIVPAAARHNLFMAVKEALNNIVRHSNATEVNLRIAITPDWLEICVEDNGAASRKRWRMTTPTACATCAIASRKSVAAFKSKACPPREPKSRLAIPGTANNTKLNSCNPSNIRALKL